MNDPDASAADAGEHARLIEELADTRARLAEAEEVLSAIRNGDVDAVVVNGEHGDQVYTLEGADLAYRQLIETMIEGAITMSADGIIVYCNVRVAETLDRPLEQVLGTPLRQFLAPDDQRLFDSVVAQAHDAPSQCEVFFVGAHGEHIPVHLSISRLQAPGKALFFCLAATNLTEIRRNEAIAAAERLARSILEQAAELIVVCDEQGRILRLSRTAEALCGPAPLMRPFLDCLPLRSETGAPFDLQGVLRGETMRNCDVSLEHDGRHIDLLLSAGPLRSEDQLRGCVINLTDITERKQDEDALRVRGAALNAAATGMVIMDRSGRISWINPAFSELTGFAAEELIGRKPRELLSRASGAHAFYEQLERTIASGDDWHGEVTNARKNGDAFVEDLTITPVHDVRGEVTHFVAINRDLTETRAIQTRLLQSQKLETVGRLAGGVAHDFNNLLTVISGIVDLSLADVNHSTALGADLLEVQRAVSRASALTRQLLAFSRQQVMQPTLVNVNVMVRDLAKMLRRLIDESIGLRLNLSEIPGIVHADLGQLEQVVVNLSVNARDAMPAGGTLTIETHVLNATSEIECWHGVLAPGRYVAIHVRDTGLGMTEATLGRLFEPFFTTKLPGFGTGLGLATVHGIVTQSGGGLQVRSVVGRGSEFTVYLPAAHEQVLEEPSVAVPHPQVGSETILVVDDEKMLRSVTSRMLTRSGFRVFTAATGEEALRMLEEQKLEVDLLITDVVMPGMAGPRLANEVRRRFPAVRILFMSGYTDDTVLRHGVDAKLVHFIDKPFTILTLAAKVRDCLDA